MGVSNIQYSFKQRGSGFLIRSRVVIDNRIRGSPKLGGSSFIHSAAFSHDKSGDL